MMAFLHDRTSARSAVQAAPKEMGVEKFGGPPASMAGDVLIPVLPLSMHSLHKFTDWVTVPVQMWQRSGEVSPGADVLVASHVRVLVV